MVERGEDYVHVKLSKRGEEIAAAAPITVVHGNAQFTFKLGDKPQRVLKAVDWSEILDRIQDGDGAKLFDLDETKQSAVSIQQSAKAAGAADDSDESGPAKRQAKGSV